MKKLLQALLLTTLLGCQEQPTPPAADDQPIAGVVALTSDYQEPHRLQYHFSPQKNWMNDPNGMVYHDGEYHLFYQYNPFGDTWGHMSWGHAVSTDMLHWKHLPLALAEEDNVMIFSGSAVVDHDNTSGFGTDGEPPMVAIYTGHRTDRKHQSQYIAYSNDRGRTWTKYEGNPVLDIDKEDFRDPKVFWHEDTGKWIMAVALPREFKIQFYASDDLKSWSHLSDFGPDGATSGIWECPDLFSLPVEGTEGRKWMLYVSINPGHPAGGSGGQYFVGDFDGTTFTLDENQSPDQPLWVDHGADFYAAVSFSDIPKEDGRRILIGWISNWAYGQKIPTSPWRSSQSVPRTYSLASTDGGYRLVQRPVREFDGLRGEEVSIPDVSVSGESEVDVSGDTFELQLAFDRPESGKAGVRLFKRGDTYTEVGYDADTGRYYIDRTQSGDMSFDEAFPGVHASPPAVDPDGEVDVRILVDRSVVEVFFEGGTQVLTDRVFAPEDAREVTLFAPPSTETTFTSLKAWPITSVW